ncbi:MAG TPA: hypothetical protein VH370_20500 [Humisphaera sp.]|jgi:hypothetical protein|nr:hypothetical protein [Humisphaera sp.]
MLKFLKTLTDKRQEREIDRREQYESLLHRAASKDDLSADESIELDALHADFGAGEDLATIAAAISEYRQLSAVAAQIARLQKDKTKAESAVDEHDAASKRIEHERRAEDERRTKQRQSLSSARSAAQQTVKEAEAAIDRRAAIEAKYWQLLKVADPAIAQGKAAVAQAAEDAARPVVVGIALTDTDACLDLARYIGTSGRFELDGHPILAGEGIDEDQRRELERFIRAVDAGDIDLKSARFLRKSFGNYRQPCADLRDKTTVVFDDVMNNLKYSPGRWREFDRPYVLHPGPGSTVKGYRAMVAEISAAIARAKGASHSQEQAAMRESRQTVNANW